ncbi:unnamed protein product [Litomosoides sigmodontis]|uniref:Uncharacterized protein n=1 Tax=Litomosoides sigmodontis TaxID=42156 RepID=A0A3P6UEQ4_LITSI|nr:unnamed protein product [Litomosoides sigmodontis]
MSLPQLLLTVMVYEVDVRMSKQFNLEICSTYQAEERRKKSPVLLFSFVFYDSVTNYLPMAAQQKSVQFLAWQFHQSTEIYGVNNRYVASYNDPNQVQMLTSHSNSVGERTECTSI